MDPAKAGSLKPVIDLKVGVALAAKRCQTCFFHDRLIETLSVGRLFLQVRLYTSSGPEVYQCFAVILTFDTLNPARATSRERLNIIYKALMYLRIRVYCIGSADG
jgi:hypothetical protein